MKLVLHLEVNERDIDIPIKERMDMSRSEIKEILTEMMDEIVEEIDDWCQIYEFKEDRRDRHRKP
jgi:actin-like ATPase involved in cell morphogenesis